MYKHIKNKMFFRGLHLRQYVQGCAVILSAEGVPFPPCPAVRMDLSAMHLVAHRRNRLLNCLRQCHAAERGTERQEATRARRDETCLRQSRRCYVEGILTDSS